MVFVEGESVIAREIRTEANARLIAKAPIAPKLAEALRKVLADKPGWLAEARAALAEWDNAK